VNPKFGGKLFNGQEFFNVLAHNLRLLFQAKLTASLKKG
jgi:hypothetical protein